jgi:serine/threonine protein kinase
MAERVAPDEEEAQFVAVKLCRPQPGEMPLMAKEGLAMTRLGDVPHCARLIDMGVVARKGGLCWIMMEHLVGTSLEEVVVTRGPLAVKEACLAAIDVLAALDGMHALGLLHRDVKPMNVMRVPLAPGSPRAWSYKLVDFGTATGLLGGTGAARAVGLPSLVLGLDGQGGSAAVPPEIEAVYATQDAGGDGRIREAEVGALLQSFGLALSEEELAVLTQRYDQDGDRAIDVEEFCAMYAELAALPYSAMAMDADFFASLGEIFVSIAQGSDTLSPAQLAECFASLARQPTEAQLQRLLEKYDTNADGAIDLHEFALMYGELAHLQDALTWAGTHGFLCPEAYNGGALSAASDVYSVGAMLFKIVSGRLPFTVTGATWGQGLVGDLTQKAPNLKSVVFNIPPEFAQIVAKALRKDASRRYGSAQEMRRALQQCLATL